jgi:hypothetical protein
MSTTTSIIIIRLVGLMLLVVGTLSALLGPAETHVFSMFREGGRFHYEGFGFGSLMFANISIQIAGYYVIAALCIPVAYGHLRLRWWVKPAMTTLLVDWLAVGLPFSLVALGILVTSKELGPATLPALILGLLLVYPVIPLVLIWFYGSRGAGRALDTANATSNWMSATPLRVRVATSLIVLLAVVLHFPLLLGGLFPLFGVMFSGLHGVFLIDLSIVAVAALAWGVALRYRWAWWGTVVLLGLLTVSSTVTFLTNQPHEIMKLVPLAPREIEAVSAIPVQGYQLALFAGIVPAATLIATVVARQEFVDDSGDSSAA